MRKGIMSAVYGEKTPPTPDQVEAKLEELAAGWVSRADASAWAERFDPDYVEDEAVFRALDLLEGCDFPSTDREYLYGEEDFRGWLKEFRAAH
jgi:hypothetical protein